MDLMNRVFQNYLDSFVIVFIDYILVYYKSENEHMGYSRVVLQVLKEHKIFSKYSKCEFWLRSIAFLGHIMSSEGIEVDQKKIEVVRNWPRPLAPIDFRSFLGLFGCYKRFVDGFESVAYSLATLTQKKVMFEWLEACKRSLQEFKEKLTYAMVLTLSEGTKGFVV